jgi:2-dehydro-3-deoxyphosphogluconate aldolase/(4S)-4-hydroxy-2-oxoglutarate aldolase
MTDLGGIEAIVAAGPVIPVVVLEDVDHAVPLARALARGGIRTVEITLRSEAGLPGIERIAAEVPEVYVGAGTVINAEQVRAATRAGAAFVVTPGSPDGLVDVVQDAGMPLLPGASTVTEMMRLLARGFTVQKFFPAEASGGAATIRAVAGPLPNLRFCPTGGISMRNAAGYLALDNVPCVGGSWLATSAHMGAGDWSAVERSAAEAATLGLQS